MKIALITAIVLLAARNIYGQNENYKKTYYRNNVNLRLGPEVAFPIGDLNKTQALGLGASALLDIPVLSRLSLILYAGALTFAGDKMGSSGVKYKRANVFPLRAGINYKLSDNFYTTGQVGQATVGYLGVSQGGVSQSIGLGYFNEVLDIGARWDHNYAHSGLGSFNIKLAYVIQIGLKR
ncbi:MAG: hypothetical protein H0U39_10685 [Segetibacter sp.]|jgi:hypothetical protein|nr:hypothetical protein [Segetibacter sp.]